MEKRSRNRNVPHVDGAMAPLLLLIPEGDEDESNGRQQVGLYNPAHHFTHTFAPQHTTTTTLNQQATQAAYELDSHPSIPQSRHTPTTHLRRLFPLFPLRRSTDALLSGHPRRSVGGVGRICSLMYSLVGLNINPLNAELNPICYLLALLGAHHFLHVSRIRVKW